MASKDYWLKFGSGNPADNSGLDPTFIAFFDYTGQTQAPPGITEIFSGSGLYRFQYEASLSIAWTVDGATTGLADSDRYISGSLDIADRNDQWLATMAVESTTLIAGMTSLLVSAASLNVGMTSILGAIGSTSSLIGDSSSDPVDLYGFMKRIHENLEGDENYAKATGILTKLDRSGATTLIAKTIAETTSQVTKT